jgi:putative ABC transport system permease protein
VERRDSGQAKYGVNNTATQITGTTPDYEEVRNFHVAEGRFISESDVKSLRKVAVLGKTVADALFPGEDPIGKKIKIKSDSYQVIGVMEKKGQSGFANPDNVIFVPASILERQSRPISTISVQAASKDVMDAVQERITEALRSNHKLKAGKEDDFRIGNQADIIATASSVSSTFTMLLGGVAAISLVVGGIGIMNIMLVTVTERTREIGVRKAIGANRYDVMLQFLIESVVISLIGGAIGILFGVAGSLLISKIGGWNTAVTVGSVLLSFGFSAAIGIFFGFYPAQRAAKLDPIVALRYE